MLRPYARRERTVRVLATAPELSLADGKTAAP
jgi:hypothetical protein